jgi:hypothetical protein
MKVLHHPSGVVKLGFERLGESPDASLDLQTAACRKVHHMAAAHLLWPVSPRRARSEKRFEKLTQSRKVAEKPIVFGRFCCRFASFAPLREMNSAFSNSLSDMPGIASSQTTILAMTRPQTEPHPANSTVHE